MPRWLKAVLWAVAIAAAVVLLFTVVFPEVERRLENPTMGLPTHPAPADPAPQAARSPR